MPLEHDDLEGAMGQFFDVTVNPHAEVLLKLMALLVSKGVISRDEAKHAVASSVGVVQQTGHSDAVKENGAEMLMRMVKALDRLPDPSR